MRRSVGTHYTGVQWALDGRTAAYIPVIEGCLLLLYIQVRQQCGKELCIVVTNLSRMCSEYCSSETCPDLPIRAAVRMSMAFPGMLYPVYTIEQTSSWLVQLTYSQLVEPAWSCKRGITLNGVAGWKLEGEQEIMQFLLRDRFLQIFDRED